MNTLNQGLNKVVTMMVGSTSTPKPDFSSGLCSYCEDFNVCCCGIFCSGYLLCKHKAHMSGRKEHEMECWEKTCGVILSIAGFYWVGAIGIAIWETCIRNDVRKSLNIVPDITFCAGASAFFCYPCAICQQERELRTMQILPVQTQPQPVFFNA
jgi:Cys-rich protein (TIGR01571 family)